ncbi:MAG: SDR family oxidoreductase [Candidatus Micrarchaeota archaeon]
MSKCLVTGGAGFVGSHICELLIEKGHEVRVIDDFSSGSKENVKAIGKKIELVEGTITKKETVDEVMKGIEYVFHEAAFVSVPESMKKPGTTWEINIRGTKLLLNAAVNNKVKRFIFASSAAVYGNDPGLPKKENMLAKVATSPYANSKRIGEMLCEEYRKKDKLPTTCLRYFNVYGPRQNPQSEYSGVITKFITTLAKGEKPIVYGDGNQTRDFIFVKDVANANLIAMEKKASSGTFNVATGKPTSINDLLDSIGKVMKKKTLSIMEHERTGDIRESYADMNKAKKELGFKAEYSLEDGLKETIEWISKQK